MPQKMGLDPFRLVLPVPPLHGVREGSQRDRVVPKEASRENHAGAPVDDRVQERNLGNVLGDHDDEGLADVGAAGEKDA